jgi:hypothetical protein
MSAWKWNTATVRSIDSTSPAKHSFFRPASSFSFDHLTELSPRDKRNVAVCDRPSWPQEGQLRHEQKDSHLIAAAGWWILPSSHFSFLGVV